MRDIWSLDIETRSTKDWAPHGALEPWRVRQGAAEITSVAVCYPDDTVKQIFNEGQSSWVVELKSLLFSLRHKIVYGQFTQFDVAFMIATIQKEIGSIPEAIRDIQWRDTKLLTKWLVNGQLAEDTKFSYSLKDLVPVFLPNHPMTAEFVEMKRKEFRPGENEEYWRQRGHWDAVLTRALAVELQDKVPADQRVGLMTEFADIAAIANSWVNGIRVDVDRIDEVDAGLQRKMDEACNLLGMEGKVLNSATQLGKYLFDELGLRPRSYGKTGPSTKKEDLMWIQFDVKQQLGNDHPIVKKMDMVMQYKKNKTLQSKYINSMKEALGNTRCDYMYGQPALFGTYTGRMTYSNETKKGYKVSIALHQIPRKNKEIRGLLLTPEDMFVLESDASGQESRLMALRSRDETMLRVFADGLNFHSMTGSAVVGMEYDEFQQKFESEDPYFVEKRQLGKLINLSCNYRIGGQALANKAFVDYDTFMTVEEGRYYVNTFCRHYPGVPQYWSDVVREAKQLGYTWCFGGRRYKIRKWGESDRWVSESSAINMPIQGAGASMKEIAIKELSEHYPELIFSLDLHDAMFSFVRISDEDRMKDFTEDVNDFLSMIDYEKYWGFKPSIPLTYESKYGRSFRDVK